MQGTLHHSTLPVGQYQQPHKPTSNTHQATVDRNALLRSNTGRPRPLQSLGSCQIHKVKLGSQHLKLRPGRHGGLCALVGFQDAQSLTAQSTIGVFGTGSPYPGRHTPKEWPFSTVRSPTVQMIALCAARVREESICMQCVIQLNDILVQPIDR